MQVTNTNCVKSTNINKIYPPHIYTPTYTAY